MTDHQPTFAVVKHYPISKEQEDALPPHVYPSECHEVGRFFRFREAKSACLRANEELSGAAYAAIVDLKTSQQLHANRYGRYDGYE